MSVLVYTESWNRSFRKSTYEALSYANATAKTLETNVIAISLGEVNDNEFTKLENYGASKVFSCNEIEKGDSQAAVSVFEKLANEHLI